MEPLLTIEDALGLFTVIKNDLSNWEEEKIALVLLMIVANPELVIKEHEKNSCYYKRYIKDNVDYSYYYRNLNPFYDNDDEYWKNYGR